MIKIIHKGNKYRLPEDWKELTIGTYQDLLHIPLDPELETEYKIKYISSLTGIDENIVEKVQKKQMDYFWEKTNWAVNSKPNNTKLNRLFEIDKEKYYFNSNLNDELVMDQFRDAFQIISNAPSFWHCAPEALSCIIHKVKKIEYDFNLQKMLNYEGRDRYNKQNYIKRVILEPYNTKNLAKKVDKLRELKVDDLSGLAFFFSNFTNELLKLTLNQSSNESNDPLLKAKIKEQLILLNKIIT